MLRLLGERLLADDNLSESVVYEGWLWTAADIYKAVT